MVQKYIYYYYKNRLPPSDKKSEHSYSKKKNCEN